MEPALEQRLIDLESRLAFQELALGELSDALAAARAEAQEQSRRLELALNDVKQLRGLLYADPSSEPPPPHY